MLNRRMLMSVNGGGGIKVPLSEWMPTVPWQGEEVDIGVAPDFTGYSGLIIVSSGFKLKSYSGNYFPNSYSGSSTTSMRYVYSNIEDLLSWLMSVSPQFLIYLTGGFSINNIGFKLYGRNSIRDFTNYASGGTGQGITSKGTASFIKAETAYIDTPSGRVMFTDWAEANGIDLNFYDT